MDSSAVAIAMDLTVERLIARGLTSSPVSSVGVPASSDSYLAIEPHCTCQAPYSLGITRTRPYWDFQGSREDEHSLVLEVQHSASASLDSVELRRVLTSLEK